VARRFVSPYVVAAHVPISRAARAIARAGEGSLTWRRHQRQLAASQASGSRFRTACAGS
jgi:hypothetical protein